MENIEKYEMIFLKFAFFVLLLGAVENITVYFQKDIHAVNIVIRIVYYFVLLIYLYFKFLLLRKGVLREKRFNFTGKVADIFIFLFGTVFFGLDTWGYCLILFPVMLAILSMGKRAGFMLLAISFIINTFFMLIRYLILSRSDIEIIRFSSSIPVYISFHFVLTQFALLYACIHEDNQRREIKRAKLLKELEERNHQLAAAQEEANYQYEKLRDANTKLEETNKQLNARLSEFFTLQHISQVISSIFDINELLKHVNDIILGVMGASNSTIMLLDEESNSLKVHITNITSKDELDILNDNVNDRSLFNIVENGSSLLKNFVNNNEFSFVRNRQVGSIMGVPLRSKTQKYGVILIEHKYCNAFNENNLRLLELIGKHVGIALENARLYQKMQEMAIRDGPTGVYNKQHFQEILEKEFKNAKENNSYLSLAIMDADNFKKLNDTYGHLFGDKVLKSIVELVKASLRSRDILARFGGEEFIILFPGTGLKEACEIAESLRKKISRYIIEDNLVSASITVSLGVSCYPETSATILELIRHADNALYKAKASGRNHVEAALPEIKI